MTAIDLLAKTARGYPAIRRSRLVGVYLLINGEDVVYVGSTTDLDVRVDTHHRSGDPRVSRKSFDRVLWLPLPSAVHHHYEGALIRFFRPIHNDRCPSDQSCDAEILFGLGLRSSMEDPS